METHGGRSRITNTMDIPDLQRSRRLVSSKSSASSKTIHTRHGGDFAFHVTSTVPMYHFARMQPSGGNEATPVFPRSGNGFGLARLIGNAY